MFKKLDIDSRYYKIIIEHLNAVYNGEARLVGGVVRDSLLNIKSSDIDIATNLLPEQVIQTLGKHNIKTIPTGIKFGTVTALVKGEAFEITTLREDIDCDGRHAKIKYSKDFALDAARRDFTINALSYCPVEHKIYDYFDGIKHLQEKKVVFIGDAEQRIKEDYLRILRFFRFSARYGQAIDETGLTACVSHKQGLEKISKERIQSEFNNLLSHPKSPHILGIMHENGILQELYPIAQYDQELHYRIFDLAKQYGFQSTLSLHYAVLFKNSDILTADSLIKLRFSRSQASDITKILKLAKIDQIDEIEFYLKSLWVEEKHFEQYFLFAAALTEENVAIYKLFLELKDKHKPILPIDGRNMMNLGYKNEKIGLILAKLKREWILSNFQLTKTTLINMAKKYAK